MSRITIFLFLLICLLFYMSAFKRDLEKDNKTLPQWLSKTAEQELAEARDLLSHLYIKDKFALRDIEKAKRSLFLTADSSLNKANNLITQDKWGRRAERLVGTVSTDTQISINAGASSYGQGLQNLETAWLGYPNIINALGKVNRRMIKPLARQKNNQGINI